MADKEVHHVEGGGGASTGLIAGILIAVLVLALIFMAGGFDFGGSKDVNVDLEAPKVQTPDVDIEAPKVPTPDTGGGKD